MVVQKSKSRFDAAQDQQPSRSSTAALLRAARSLIERPGAWCQYALAVSATGEDVDETDPCAVRFCALGAVHRADFDLKLRDDGAALSRAWEQLSAAMDGNIVIFNNRRGRKQATILRRFDRAIAAAEVEERGADGSTPQQQQEQRGSQP